MKINGASWLLAIAGVSLGGAMAASSPHPLKHSRRGGKPDLSGNAAWRLQARINKVADELAIRADYHWHRGEFADVAFCQRQIVDLDPSDVMTWSTLGWIEWACLNNEVAAERTLREGIAANPHRYELYDELGTYLYRRKRYAESAASLAKAVSFKNAHPVTWNQYGHSLEKMGRIDRAAEVWREMRRKFPDNPSSQVNLDRLKRKGLI